jgi:hypothetical protein
MSLRESIQALSEQFAVNILTAMKGASLQDIAGLSGHRAPERRNAPRTAKPATKAKALSKKPGKRRSPEDVQALAEKIVAEVKKAGEGIRIEQVGKALGLKAADMRIGIDHALEAKMLTKRGQKRATKYYVKA